NLQNQKVYLDNMLKDPLSSTRQGGAKSIMDNRNALKGILGVIGQVVIFPSRAHVGGGGSPPRAAFFRVLQIVAFRAQSAPV
ncbi:MAG: hypothetical protein II590_01725, partial [Clostridia bacterium]|nr:hypothetical protein [Clostridia bacterium]